MSSAPLHRPHLVLGAGLAGLSAAYHCPSAHVLEANSYVGGKARTERIDGFTFDVTGHWLHLRDPEMRALVLSLCGAEHFVKVERMSRVWSHGVYTLYPFQANTFGLPPEVVKECVMGAIEARARRPAEPDQAGLADANRRSILGDVVEPHGYGTPTPSSIRSMTELASTPSASASKLKTRR